MATVDEYLRMAEEAGEKGEHVAVFSYYRNAIEAAGHVTGSAPVLLEAVKYAQGLKKEGDRYAIARWGTDALEKMQPESGLAAAINREIEKLSKSVGNASA